MCGRRKMNCQKMGPAHWTGSLEKKKAWRSAVMRALLWQQLLPFGTTAAGLAESNKVLAWKANSSCCRTEQQEDAKDIEGEEHKGRWSVSLLLKGVISHLEKRRSFSYSTKMPRIILNAMGVVQEGIAGAPLRSTFWLRCLAATINRAEKWEGRGVNNKGIIIEISTLTTEIVFYNNNKLNKQQQQAGSNKDNPNWAWDATASKNNWHTQPANAKKVENENKSSQKKTIWQQKWKLTPIVGRNVPPLENALGTGQIFWQLKGEN